MQNLKLDTSRVFAQWLARPYRASSVPPPRTHVDLPVLVVGAGPAGLSGMSALIQAGVACEGVESHSQVGGIWDESNPISSIYEGLHTVTSRYTSHVGPPMPEDWPNYPHHRQAHEYLVRFAEAEGLMPRFRLNTSLVGAVKSARGTWIVTLRRKDGDATYEQEVRALVIATGSHNKRHSVLPEPLRDQAVASGIDVLHSAEYKSPTPYAGKRVLVVGIGNSGSDIAEKISSVAHRTLLAVRTSPWINPQTAGGVPCDKLAADSNKLPEWLKLGWFHMVRRLSIGSFRSLGLTKPRCALNDRLPISDRGIVQAIRAGRVIVRSNVTGFSDGMARFADPAHQPEPVDVVIFATGFGRSYPLLTSPEGNGASLSDALLFLMFHRSEPGLGYLAEVIGLHSCWPIFVEQGRALAAYFAAEQRGGPNVDPFNSRRGLPSPEFKGRLFRRADGFHVDYNIYTQVIRDLTAWLSQ